MIKKVPALGLNGDMKLEGDSGNGGDMKPEGESGEGDGDNKEFNNGSVTNRTKKTEKMEDIIPFFGIRANESESSFAH